MLAKQEAAQENTAIGGQRTSPRAKRGKVVDLEIKLITSLEQKIKDLEDLIDMQSKQLDLLTGIFQAKLAQRRQSADTANNFLFEVMPDIFYAYPESINKDLRSLTSSPLTTPEEIDKTIDFFKHTIKI